MRRRDVWATAAALGFLGFGLALVLQRDVGVARDETVYMHAGTKYAEWWMRLVRGDVDNIDRTWGGPLGGENNPEHPPLMKTWFGLSERILHDDLGVTSELTGYRAPSCVLCGVLVALVFLFAAAVWGYVEGVLAALLTLLLPRALFHAGLACFDAPIVTFWIATVLVYWKALRARWWSLIAGVAWGAALATKHNALILPAVVLAHYAWVALRPAVVKGATRLPWRSALAPTVMLGVGPFVLFLLWPLLWHDPYSHVQGWISFHLHHTHYNFEYLGLNWNAPPFPWHVPIVTTLFTVPVVTLAAGALGAAILVVRAGRGASADAERAPGLLLFLSAGAAVGPFLLGSMPIFGAEKHWAAAIPSIAIAAGVGLAWAARRTAAWAAGQRAWPLWESAALALLGGLAIAAAGGEVVASHPYALSHYNALAGGAPGGGDLGMNRQFWGVAARGVLPWLRAQPRGPVYSHDASPAWLYYRKWGLLPPDFDDAGHEEVGIARSKYALVIHELHFNRHDYLIWKDFGTVQPAYVLTDHGVPVVSVYARLGR